MDIKIILGWSIAVLAITGWIILIRLRNKNRLNEILKPLLVFAQENNSEISFFDYWDKTLIGVDNHEINRLFFIRNTPCNVIREKITLSEVSECKILKTERKVKYYKELVNVIDRIELIFSFNNHRPELSLEFYNTDYDQLTLSGELQLAEKWAGTLKTIINLNQESKTKAKKKELIKPVIARS
jgi:hypothetical protein